MNSRQGLADELTRARQRTLRLVEFDDDELRRQYHPLMSPLVWDLAHIGQQEELWLLRGGHLDKPGLLPPGVDSLYDAFVHPRASRVALPLLTPTEAHRYLDTVRAKAFDALDTLTEDDPAFAFGLVVSHENQHGETMLQALNLRSGTPLLDSRGRLPAGRVGVAGSSVLVPAGPFVLGVDAADRTLLPGQRTPRARRRRPGVPDRPGAGDQRRMARVRRRRRPSPTRHCGTDAAGNTANRRA